MRILHTADLHLDSPLRAQGQKNPAMADAVRAASRRVLRRIVDLAIESSVDAVVMAGDIFDSDVADVASRSALAIELSRLSRAGIPTLLIRGNHDALLDIHHYGPIAEGVHLLDAARPTVEIAGAAFHGLSHDARHTERSLLPDYPAPLPGKVNIGLMHTSLGGAEGHDRYAPCAEADLLGHGYDYWALGHIHKRGVVQGDAATLVMPGIPQGRSVRELGRGSVTLAEITPQGTELTEVAVAEVAFDIAQVDLTGRDSAQAQIRALRQALEAARRPDHGIALRVIVRGAADLAYLRALAQYEAEDIDGVFLEALRPAQAEAPKPPAGAVRELAEMMAADAATPGFRDEAQVLVREWRDAMPREIADTLNETTLDELTALGLQMVIARLRPGDSDQDWPDQDWPDHDRPDRDGPGQDGSNQDELS